MYNTGTIFESMICGERPLRRGHFELRQAWKCRGTDGRICFRCLKDRDETSAWLEPRETRGKRIE